MRLSHKESKMAYDFKTVCKQFDVKGEYFDCVPYGEGHINETFLLTTANADGSKNKYILQRINSNLFKDVARLMNNIYLVTEFARKKIVERGGNPDRESLTVVKTKDDGLYYCDGTNFFRIYLFIDDATAYQKVEKPEHFYESAVAFGNFANLLAEFDASKLYEPLPDFHNTVKRFENLEVAIAKNKAGRLDGVKAEVAFALLHKPLVDKIVYQLQNGIIPCKVTHNDTKLNNVLIDNATDKAVAVIDLDTIMPGTIVYDFGDSIRFGCNPAAEDEQDLSKVNFDIALFEQYVKGYMSTLRGSMTPAEAKNLALGAILMTYECGIRFLTDHLEGDVYFRIKRENHNLDRARTQFKLVSDMESVFDQMNAIVDKYYNEK